MTDELPGAPTGDDATEPQHGRLWGALRRFSTKEWPTRRPISPAHTRAVIITLQAVSFLSGWVSGSNGPLIPYLQADYHVDYAIMSLIYIFTFLGTFSMSFMVGEIADRLGIGICIPVGLFVRAMGLMLCAFAPPYPAFVFGFFVQGLSQGASSVLVNPTLTRTADGPFNIGVAQSLFGLGAGAAPLVATLWTQHSPHTAQYFFFSMGLSLLMAILLVLVLRGRRTEEVIPQEYNRVMAEKTRPAPTNGSPDEGEQDVELSLVPLEAVMSAASRRTATRATTTGENPESNHGGPHILAVLKMPYTLLMALYLFIYVGIEIGYGAWIVTYLLDKREQRHSLGYIASGYYFSVAVFRLLLMQVTKKLGPRFAVPIYSLLCMACVGVVWGVKNIYVDGVAVALLGGFLGPIFPICINMTGSVVPRRLLTTSLAFTASCGFGGSAIWPFVIGLLSQRFDIGVLQPVALALLGCSIILWLILSRYSAGATADG